MLANVTEQLWIDFNLDTAVFLDTIAYWLKKNAANKQVRNFRESRYWTYNTLDGFRTLFPGWSRETIRRIIRNCVKHNLLLVGNFNRKGYDRTSWYSLTDIALEYYPALSIIMQKKADNSGGYSCVDSNTSDVGSNTPIPKLLPSSSINTTTSDLPKVSCDEVVEAYHEVLPACPKIKVIGNDLTKQIRSMIKNWPKYQKEGKPFCIDSFKDYLQYIKTYYPWFIQPYESATGKIKRNNLTNITREKNIVRIVNGEFSGN